MSKTKTANRETILQRVASIENENALAFDELVARVVAEQPVDDDEAIAILRAAGKTAEDLQKAVARQQEISKYRIIAAEGPDAERKLRELSEKRAKEIERFEQELRELHDRMQQADLAYSQAQWPLRVAIQNAGDANRRLRELETPPTPTARPKFVPPDGAVGIKHPSDVTLPPAPAPAPAVGPAYSGQMMRYANTR